MQSKLLKTILNKSGLAATILLLASGMAGAQSVSLTASPQSAVLPDGQTVQMWGYACGSGASAAVAPASCAALNPNAGTGWSPVVITVPPGPLTINLTNNLPVPPGAQTGIPTSLVIVGQLGGGLGNSATSVASPTHAIQGVTWPIAGDTSGSTFNPPAQGPRVQSFSTEVTNGTTSSLTWNNLKPGTYLIQSGTHPSIQAPMGLYGVLVVTTAPTLANPIGTAYPGVTYNAEIPLLLSEIDPVQNGAVAAAVVTAGFNPSAIRVLRDSVSSVGLALDNSGNAINAGTGYHVGDQIAFTGGGFRVAATAHVSAVDGVGAITAIVVDNPGVGYYSVPSVTVTRSSGTGTTAQITAALSLAGVICNDGALACYPPAVNYDPRYYMVNGVAFDRTKMANSMFQTIPATVTGNVLVRFVNAGLRMHVPSIVGAQTGSPATSGFALIAEDGNVLPGSLRIQSEVFLAAGKTYDVMINAPANAAPALAMFDRQLSLSTNNQRDGGMQAYISANSATLNAAVNISGKANPDSYFLVAGNTLAITDPAKGVIANDVGVSGVKVMTQPSGGMLNLNADGTFSYVPNAGTTTDSFTYCGNGATSGLLCTAVTFAPCTGACRGNAPTAVPDNYSSKIASRLHVSPPGVLANDTDPSGLPLTASAPTNIVGGSVTLNPDGSFTVVPSVMPVSPGQATVTFQYRAVNSQKTVSTTPATVTVVFSGASGLNVKVMDGPSMRPGATPVQITDYRWIIEEDRTVLIDPKCQVNSTPRPAGCPPLPVVSLGTNFHTSYMPVVASGCVGTFACESGQTVLDTVSGSHLPAVCDIGNGVCRVDAGQKVPTDPSQVALDPTKRYYISILPGDGGNTFSAGAGAPVTDSTTGNKRPFSISLDCPSGAGGADFAPGTGTCGHGMGGAPIAPGQQAVNVVLQQTPFATAKISVYVFEDDAPLNGEIDVSGGTDVFGTAREPGLSGFEIKLFDDAGGTGDPTGQMTYDMFNMPLSNSLAGTIDPLTGLDACPISKATSDGLVGMIPTCPKFESDGQTLSPLVGKAVIANLMPGRYGVIATPAADRIGRGEEWLQTNTLDGQKAHDAFIKIGGPGYFQEFGPAGYHVTIGFANPKIINARLPALCAGNNTCNNSVSGKITGLHISRTPDQRLYSTGSRNALGFTQCYVSLGDVDLEDFAFTKCAADGTFSFSGIPDGTWRITVFDQWNDQIVDGLAAAVQLQGGQSKNMGDIPVLQWHTNIYTRSFIDLNKNGVSDANEPGLALVPTNVRFRDGSYSNFNNTDLNGYAPFNEVFPLFSWYVIEGDTTRFKQTGVHVVYDAGGPVDGTPGGGTSTIAANLANTKESPTAHLPINLRVPGAVYCDNADCTGYSIQNGPASSGSNPSTGRIDPPLVTSYGWQGFLGQSSFIEFGKTPFASNENGGIRGEVIYASTRPFDDPALLIHAKWTPNVPNVTVNLYQRITGPDGTPTLKLVDTTKTASWDDWAQGFRKDANGNTILDESGNGIPNINCPGQESTDPFFYTLKNSPSWLNAGTPIANNSQFKCYDGMHAFNQLQPAPYDGMYNFPSVTASDPVTGKPTKTNCTICVPNPTGDGTQMLPPGKYVVEVIVPPGYELVKEEDKNILIGDNYIAPVTQQFAGLGNIFILPDQAAVNAKFNRNNPQNPTVDLGSFPRAEGDTGSVERKWPCVGAMRVVPDFISLFPGSQEVAPFAGATRPLCDRKEVVLEDQNSVLVKFWLFSSAHVAAHYTGFMLDDFSSEFDPYSPQFGEKFAPPNLPIALKDFTGNEVSRVYADSWGLFNGLQYSTWEVNPPNPTGYAPTMMVACMNDPGPIMDTVSGSPTFGQMITDPNFNPAYSQFCYEIPYMPGQTQYMDTPVVPVQAFASGYNQPDCAYPDATPAIASVLGDAIPNSTGRGPWVSLAGHVLTINALGDQKVPNHAYSGPQATTAPYNQKFITRHYGFGATQGRVTIGDTAATIVSWSDTQIRVTAPSIATNRSTCTIPQRGVIGAQATIRCGELVITAANGKKSVDTVTVTIGGKPPTYVAGENVQGNAIQAAIDNATPGDMIIVGPGSYPEMLIMWKPVRLQGVAAASVNINANSHPSGKLEPWRRQVDCLFGVALNGQPVRSNNPFDSTGTYTCATASVTDNPMRVDRIPLEGMLGWDSTLNGNLAEMLIEPTLMGAYEGAGITVLAKGVRYDCAAALALGATGGCPWGDGDVNNTSAAIEGQMPLGTQRLTNSSQDCIDFPSNFLCNPSRIDGLTITNSSQGGGGIFVHGWAHSLEISNNRVYSNTGTLTGGITVGQPETPDGWLVGDSATNQDNVPGTCLSQGAQNALAAGVQLPFCFNTNANLHHNMVTSNSNIGDEVASSTPAAGGGVTFCTGADFYQFNNNWVCGNLSTGDGGGVTHYGFIYNGNISHNTVIFNQSNNPTLPTYGGGILIMGMPPDGTFCEGQTVDFDCAPSLAEGAGPGLVIDSNLIMGNTAEGGKGGGLRLQLINGVDVRTFPSDPSKWYQVTVTNNIITNNVAGWSGGGVSLQDALRVNFINNTVVGNDATASAGVLFNTGLAAISNITPPGCTISSTSNEVTCPTGGSIKTSSWQPAGLETSPHTANLRSAFTVPTVACPSGLPNCTTVSNPVLDNNIFWQNRSFYISVGGLNPQIQGLQNIVNLNPTLNQAGHQTGYCDPNAVYWDIGVFGDARDAQTGSIGHQSGFTLRPRFSILTNAADYPGQSNKGLNPNVISQYCNGSRLPPEAGGAGYSVPPGIADAVLPNPLFTLLPTAVPDEGNQWINLFYGPLSMTNATITSGAGYNVPLANSGLQASSPAINAIPNTAPTYAEAPSVDFFGTARKTNSRVDMGAVEFVGSVQPAAVVSPTSLNFGNQNVGTTSAAPGLVVTVQNAGGSTLQITGLTFTPQFVIGTAAATTPCSPVVPFTLVPGASCNLTVRFAPTATGPQTGTLTIATNDPAHPTLTVTLGGTGAGPAATLTPSPVAFGNQAVGTTSSVHAVTLTNSGTSALTLGAANAVTVSGNFAIVAAGTTCNNGTVIAAGNTCTINLTFSPTAAGAASGTLTVADNATPSSQSVSLTGTGTGGTSASLTLVGNTCGTTAGVMAFGSVTGSKTCSATLTNTGATTLSISGIGLTAVLPIQSPNPFSQTNDCGGTLTAGQSCTVNVVFTPNNITAVIGGLSVTDGAGIQALVLSGR